MSSIHTFWGRAGRPGRWRSGLVVVLGVVVLLGVGAEGAIAASPSAGWRITSLAQPSNFAMADNQVCIETGSSCDSYTVTVTNAGLRESNGAPVVIIDRLPSGVTFNGVVTRISEAEGEIPGVGFEWLHNEIFDCEESEVNVVRCTYPAGVPAGDVLQVGIHVTVASSAESEATNEATVEGGGAATVTTGPHGSSPNLVNGPPTMFGLQDFAFDATEGAGRPDTLAGDHPYSVTASFDLKSVKEGNERTYHPAQEAKNIVVSVPLGLVGDPLAAQQCPEGDLEGNYGVTDCPADSQIGMVALNLAGFPHLSLQQKESEVSPLYNMVPEKGYPAEFGFNYTGREVVMYASVVPSPAGYMVRVSVPGVIKHPSSPLTVDGGTLTVFGNPAEHDLNGQGEQVSPNAAFLTNPMDCSARPLQATIETNSWVEPHQWQSATSTVYEANQSQAVTGCNLLQFNPTLELRPESSQADEPAGYAVDLKVPQAANLPGVSATPELKNATVTLPEGVSVSPSAADGLVGCQATGPEGINVGSNDVTPLGQDLGDPWATEIGEGHGGPGGNGSSYDDGLYHTAHGHCPNASQIGTVEVVTPLLPSPLTGRVFVAQPKCGGEGQPACTEAEAAAGNLFGLYIEAEGSGVIIKLAGNVSANPSTGRLTATFRENPQLPFSDLKLQFKGGPRAPLANPQSCGTYTTTSDLSSWASPEVPDATPSSSFEVGGCEGDPFAPSFSAGTVTPLGGGYSPFTLTFSRKDREQDLAGITVNTPPGLLGKIAGVEQCPEPQAGQGTCGPNSLIGHTNVAAGAGSHPYWVSGNVYLTGPYEGAPFGLSVVVPTVAGPFRLAGSNGQGDEVVRAAIRVNPNTSALSVTSDPLPQIVDGVPLRIQTVNVTIDRPGFMLNPTNCAQQAITGTVTSTQGATAGVSSPFAVAGCANLPFKPSFAVSTQAVTSKANGASLGVKVGSGAGQANIAKVRVTLPKQLPARLTTLQKACTDTQFYSNPAGCPAASIVGMAVAHTPVLANPLSGPAYLVSHGGVAFPDLVFVLQGEGIVLYLDGNTDIRKGITTSTFNSVPDAPISSFETVFGEGPHSVLAANLPAKAKGSMCGQALTMPTTLTGQNGAVVTQTTKIGVTGCAKAKKKAKGRHKGKRKGGRNKK